MAPFKFYLTPDEAESVFRVARAPPKSQKLNSNSIRQMLETQSRSFSFIIESNPIVKMMASDSFLVT